MGNFKSVWRQMEELVDEGKALSLGLRGDHLDWEAPGNIAGLCLECKFFLHEARHRPLLVFTESLDRTAVPPTEREAELWKRLGIVVIGSGLVKQLFAKRLGMSHQHALRLS